MKSYDPGLTDIDPARWEKSYVDAVAPFPEDLYEVPKYIDIRKELPLTVVGKIDKKVLRKEAV